jgi:hypothetical protein
MVTRGLALVGLDEAEACAYLTGKRAGLLRLVLAKCRADLESKQLSGPKAFGHDSIGQAAVQSADHAVKTAAATYVRAVHVATQELNAGRVQEARATEYEVLYQQANLQLWPNGPFAGGADLDGCAAFVEEWTKPLVTLSAGDKKLVRAVAKTQGPIVVYDPSPEEIRRIDLSVGVPFASLLHDEHGAVRRRARFVTSSVDAVALASHLVSTYLEPKEFKYSFVAGGHVITTFRCNEVGMLALLARNAALRATCSSAPISAPMHVMGVELRSSTGAFRCGPLFDAVRAMKVGPAICEVDDCEQAKRVLANTMLLRAGTHVVLQGLTVNTTLNGCRGVIQPYPLVYRNGWIVPPDRFAVALAVTPPKKIRAAPENLHRAASFLCVMTDMHWDSDIVPGAFVVDPSDTRIAGTVVSVSRATDTTSSGTGSSPELHRASSSANGSTAMVRLAADGTTLVRRPLEDLCATPDPSKTAAEQPPLCAKLLRDIAEHVPKSHLAAFSRASLAIVGDHGTQSGTLFESESGSHLHPDAQEILQRLPTVRITHQHALRKSTHVYDLRRLHFAVGLEPGSLETGGLETGGLETSKGP